MITNFEEITVDLSDKEIDALPIVVDVFKSIDKPLKSKELVFLLNSKCEGLKVTDVRLRKFCNYIRSKHILPIIATSDGYFVSYDPEVIQKQVLSLKERANSIIQCGHGLIHFLNLPEVREVKQLSLLDLK